MSQKLRAPWKGPFVIVFKTSDLNYIIKPLGGRTLKIVHLNKLKPYRDGLPLTLQEAPDDNGEPETAPAKPAAHTTKVTSGGAAHGNLEEELRGDGTTDQPTGMEVEEEVENDFEVEAVTDKRTKKDGTVEYKLQWKGYPHSQSTWESESHLACPKLVQEYELQHSRGRKRKPAHSGPRQLALPPNL